MLSSEAKKRLATVDRSVRWFNMLARLLLLIGAGTLAIAVVVSMTDFLGADTQTQATELYVSGISNMLIGGLFVLVRDAFRVLTQVVRDTADIV